MYAFICRGKRVNCARLSKNVICGLTVGTGNTVNALLERKDDRINYNGKIIGLEVVVST